MFKKVLAATARPLECDESVLSAGLIAQFNHAKLLILHVLESNASIYRNYVKHYRTGKEIVGDVFYQDEVKEELAKNCRNDLPSSLKYEIRIACGVPWVEALKWASEESVDLIVLGAHTGRSYRHDDAASRAAVGSTTEGLIKHERCPLMIASKPIPEEKAAFKKILVGIDFSPSCFSAFRFASKVAKKRGSKLYLYHMSPVPPQPEYSQTQYEADIREKRMRLQKEFCHRLPDAIEAEIETWGGVYPDIEILKCARRCDADLIVMGSHTKITGMLETSRWYVGSAVERVSARAICPVAVITDPKVLNKWAG